MIDYAPHLATIAAVLLLAAISPGPNFVAVTAHAMVSRRLGLSTAMGITTASLTWATLSVCGLGLVLAQVAWLFDAVRIAGALYLVWIGVKMLRSAFRSSASAEAAAASPVTTAGAFRRGVLTSMTNPKVAAFYTSLFVTALPVGAPAEVYGATLLIVVLVIGGWNAGLALLFSTALMRRFYGRGRRVLDAVMGTILVGLGIRLGV